MTLVSPTELTTDGVVLRRFVPGDSAAFGDFMARPENTRFMTFPEEMRNRQAGAQIVAETIAAYANPGAAMALAICRPDDRTIIGACGAFETGETEIEIFYLVFERYRGCGYAKAAAKALVRHFRRTKPQHDLTARVDQEHSVSKLILEGLGFVDSGPCTVNGRPSRLMLLKCRPRSVT